ncbi:hypothetical protein BS47DRAFT_50388 [Hydnum rufescens UP504]|uniref:Uncharacterized protein n=1 Tax=Hydnum rufescens UP504 TaxID=1448309 RepID=A0A9P6AS51_9AGAM|nr:hypothetical protein BS47DRAFT_50388 [Hydnum rufescens UP504]
MQIASSDTIVRRRQSVAALHDNLMSWRGLGSSILALWRSRKLDVRTWLRVLLAFMFFGGVSVLHIVTPSVITVGTFNATRPVPLNVSTMPDFQPWIYFHLPPLVDPIPALPYLWSQLRANTTGGLLAGVNGSVMFSTLPSVMTGDVVFQDPYARDVSVRCGIIPRVSGDSFQVLYIGPGPISSFPTAVSLSFDIQVGFTLYPGHLQWYNSSGINISMNTGAFSIGGNKESISAHPVFSFDDILLMLPYSYDLFATAFAYISTRNDSLKLDPLVSFAPPVQYTLQAQTWSFINNDTKSKPPV